MAQMDASSTIIQFSVWEISKLTTAYSQSIVLFGIPWQVHVEYDDEEKSLAAYLHCAKKDDLSNWTAVASASIKLLRQSQVGQGIVSLIPPVVFDRFTPGYGTRTLIEWTDLFNSINGYVQNDCIKLEVKIEAEDPYDLYRSYSNFRCIEKSCECSCQATYELNVMNVTKLMAVRTTEFVMRLQSYDILVYKNGTHLAIRLWPNRRYTEVTPHNVKMLIKLTSSKQNVAPVQRSGSADINIISWDELLKPENGFVNYNNAITLEIEINVNDLIRDNANAEPNGGATTNRFECSICLDGLGDRNMSTTPCGHLFCTTCITAAVRNRSACPMCQAGVQLNDLRRLYLTA